MSNLPAITTDKNVVTLTQDEAGRLQRIIHSYIQEKSGTARIQNPSGFYLILGLMSIGGLASGVPAALLFLTALPMAGHSYNKGLKKAKEEANKVFEDSNLYLNNALGTRQITAFHEKSETLISLAEAELAKGHMLDEKVLAYLVAAGAGPLHGKSDTLAITVMQARSAIRFVRAAEKRNCILADMRVPTMQMLAEQHRKKMGIDTHFSFSMANEKHRKLLRDELKRQDRYLEEAVMPETFPCTVPGVSKTELECLKPGIGGTVLRYLAPPLFVKSDSKKIEDMLKKAIPDTSHDIHVPALRRVENFSQMLEDFERATGQRLELPALRGEDGTSALAPKPKSLPKNKKRSELKPR